MKKLKQIEALVKEAYEKIDNVSVDAHAVRAVLTDLAKRSAEIEKSDWNGWIEVGLSISDIIETYNSRLRGEVKEEPKQETLEEAAEIDLTNLCYYDKRNPDCSLDDEDIEGHKKSLLKKNKTCSCDNCFYGRSKLMVGTI